MKQGLTPSQLLLPYDEWTKLIGDFCKPLNLDIEHRAWMHEWARVDLARSPMDDILRRHMRYGHYLGWMARSEVI